MAYNTEIADKVRDALAGEGLIEERLMFGACGFMVNGKLTICVGEADVMYKLGPEGTAQALDSKVAKPVIMNKRTMKSWVNISNDKIKNDKDFDMWLRDALAHNKASS